MTKFTYFKCTMTFSKYIQSVQPAVQASFRTRSSPRKIPCASYSPAPPLAPGNH